MDVDIVHFYELNDKSGRALKNNGDGEVWQMIPGEFY